MAEVVERRPQKPMTSAQTPKLENEAVRSGGAGRQADGQLARAPAKAALKHRDGLPVLFSLALFVASAVAFQEGVLAGHGYAYFVIGFVCLMSAISSPALLGAWVNGQRQRLLKPPRRQPVHRDAQPLAQEPAILN